MGAICIRPRRCRSWDSTTTPSVESESSRASVQLALGVVARVFLFEKIQRITQAFFQVHLGFPAQEALGFGNVRAALLGVIFRQRFVNNFLGIREIGTNSLGKFLNGEFGWISDVGGEMLIGLAELVD